MTLPRRPKTQTPTNVVEQVSNYGLEHAVISSIFFIEEIHQY